MICEHNRLWLDTPQIITVEATGQTSPVSYKCYDCNVPVLIDSFGTRIVLEVSV